MRASMLRVLTYHRVLDPKDPAASNPALVSATPRGFERQMRHLAAHYAVVSAAEVLDALRTGRPLPRRAVLITFDDAYRDFGEIAWPILRRYGLTATVFVATSYPDHPERTFWWDRLHRALVRLPATVLECPPLGRLPLNTPERRRSTLRALQQHIKATPHDEAMQLVASICRDNNDDTSAAATVHSWAELRALARDGATIGGHTQTHPALTQIEPACARSEIRGCRADLERELGSVVPVFSYPFGSYDSRVIEIAREEGFELGVTCDDGHNDIRGVDPLRMYRTNITRRTGPLVFSLRLLPLFSHLDRWRHSRPMGGQLNAIVPA